VPSGVGAHVAAQRGGKLTDGRADALLAQIEIAMDDLGC